MQSCLCTIILAGKRKFSKNKKSGLFGFLCYLGILSKGQILGMSSYFFALFNIRKMIFIGHEPRKPIAKGIAPKLGNALSAKHIAPFRTNNKLIIRLTKNTSWFEAMITLLSFIHFNKI